jgi:hypothetical protein
MEGYSSGMDIKLQIANGLALAVKILATITDTCKTYMCKYIRYLPVLTSFD